jgi:hypothetical protein
MQLLMTLTNPGTLFASCMGDTGYGKSRSGVAAADRFGGGLRETVRWYREHAEWVAAIRTGQYLQ